MNLIPLCHIDAGMKRQVFPFVDFFAFGKKQPQLFLQSRRFRLYGKMIRADPAAVFISEQF